MSPEEAFDHLKKWRLEESRKENVKAFQVFSDRVLHALSEKMPATLEELDSISGVSDRKISRYGNSVLKILDDVRPKNMPGNAVTPRKESNSLTESEISVSAFVDRLNR